MRGRAQARSMRSLTKGCGKRNGAVKAPFVGYRRPFVRSPRAPESAEQARARRSILLREPVDELRGRPHRIDHADALPTAPDVLPGLGLALVEVHLPGIALGQAVRIESRRGARGTQGAAVAGGGG